MFLHTQNIPKKHSKLHYFLFAFYLISIFAIEPFYRNSLFNASKTLILNIQSNTTKNDNNLYPFAKFFSDMGNIYPFGLIIFAVYSFCNIYKTFTLLTSLFLGGLFAGSLKMIYMSPRPYFEDSIIPLENEAGWGSPSSHAIFSVSFYLTFWEILFQNSNFAKRKFEKYAALVFAILLIALILVSRIILAAHAINQLIFGALIGFAIYYFLFFVLKIDTNNPNQFLAFIETRNLIYSFVNIILLVFAALLFILNLDDQNQTHYLEVIKEKFQKSKLELPPSAKTLQYEGLLTIIVFFANFSVFMAIKFELFFDFQGNTQNWKSYNFNCKLNADDESLMTSLSPINNITQWNHTNSFFHIIRIVITMLVLFLINYPFHFINWNNEFVIVLLFKVLFPIGNSCFFLFFLLKKLFKCLRLTNNTLYSRMIDNTDNPFP